jgi:hypothetical protein
MKIKVNRRKRLKIGDILIVKKMFITSDMPKMLKKKLETQSIDLQGTISLQ